MKMDNKPEPNETFIEWYKRTRGCEWPGHDFEAIHHVFRRLADALAEWADFMRKSAE